MVVLELVQDKVISHKIFNIPISPRYCSCISQLHLGSPGTGISPAPPRPASGRSAPPRGGDREGRDVPFLSHRVSDWFLVGAVCWVLRGLHVRPCALCILPELLHAQPGAFGSPSAFCSLVRCGTLCRRRVCRGLSSLRC